MRQNFNLKYISGIDVNFESERPKQSITPSSSLYNGSSEDFKHAIDSNVDDFHISDLDLDLQQVNTTTTTAIIEKLPPRKYFNFVNVT